MMRVTPFYDQSESTFARLIETPREDAAAEVDTSNLTWLKEESDLEYTKRCPLRWTGVLSFPDAGVELHWWWSDSTNRVIGLLINTADATVQAQVDSGLPPFAVRQFTRIYPDNVHPISVAMFPQSSDPANLKVKLVCVAQTSQLWTDELTFPLLLDDFRPQSVTRYVELGAAPIAGCLVPADSNNRTIFLFYSDANSVVWRVLLDEEGDCSEPQEFFAPEKVNSTKAASQSKKGKGRGWMGLFSRSKPTDSSALDESGVSSTGDSISGSQLMDMSLSQILSQSGKANNNSAANVITTMTPLDNSSIVVGWSSGLFQVLTELASDLVESATQESNIFQQGTLGNRVLLQLKTLRFATEDDGQGESRTALVAAVGQTKSGIELQLYSVSQSAISVYEADPTAFIAPKFGALPRISTFHPVEGFAVAWEVYPADDDDLDGPTAVSLSALCCDAGRQRIEYHLVSRRLEERSKRNHEIFYSKASIESVAVFHDSWVLLKMNEPKQRVQASVIHRDQSPKLFDNSFVTALETDNTQLQIWGDDEKPEGFLIPDGIVHVAGPGLYPPLPRQSTNGNQRQESEVERVFLEGLRLLQSVPDATGTFRTLLQRCVSSPTHAASLADFRGLAAAAQFYSVPPEGIDGNTMKTCADYVLRDFSELLNSKGLFCTSNRSFVSFLATQVLTERLTVLALCHLAWVTTSPAFATDLVLSDVRHAFKIIAGALSIVQSLGVSLIVLPPPDANGGGADFGNQPQQSGSFIVDYLNSLVAIHRAPLEQEAVEASLFKVGYLLLNNVMDINLPLALRALQGFVNTWKNAYPILNHFSIIVILSGQKPRGSMTAQLLMSLRSVCSAMSQCSLGVLENPQLYDSLRATDDPFVIDGFLWLLQKLQQCDASLNAVKGVACNLYCTCLLRTLVKRDPSALVAQSAVDLSLVEPELLSSLSMVQYHFDRLLDEEEDPQEPFKVWLTELRDDVLILLLRPAVEELETQKALYLLLQLHRGKRNSHVIQFYMDQLVVGLLAKDQGMELVDAKVSDHDLLQLLTALLWKHVQKPITTSNERNVRETKRESNTMVLYSLLMKSGEYCLAALAAYEVGHGMREAPQCTATTLSYALRCLTLAIHTLQCIPKTIPPVMPETQEQEAERMLTEEEEAFGGGGSGRGGSGSGSNTPFSSIIAQQSLHSSYRFFGLDDVKEFPKCLPNIIKQEHQLRCELKLLMQGRSSGELHRWSKLSVSKQETDPATIAARRRVVSELLAARLFQDAVEFSATIEDDLGICFRTHAQELLEGRCLQEREGWQTLAKRLSRYSNKDNNYDYIRQTNDFIVNHATAEALAAVDPVIPGLLRAVDPSGLLEIYIRRLQKLSALGHDAPRGKSALIRLTLTLLRDFYAAKKAKSWARYGFKEATAHIASSVQERALRIVEEVTTKKQFPDLQALAGEVQNLAN